MYNSTLRELVTHLRETPDARFASVYYDATHDTEDAEKRLELTWRDLREQLESQGADPETVQALDAAITDAPRAVGRRGRALIAAGERVSIDAELAIPPPRSIARWSSLPYLVPLIELGVPAVAHVIAAVDKVGAEVTAIDDHGDVVDRHTVVGTEHPVHEVRAVGGAPRGHVREHARENVKHNLSKVADEVGSLADRVKASFIVVSGEVKGRLGVRKLLPERLQEHTIDFGAGGAKEGVDNAAIRSRVRELVGEEQHRRTDTLIDRLRAEAGRSDEGLVAQGITATCAALREANVEALVIGGDGDRLVYVGADPIELATEALELSELGISPVEQRRADEALPFAAVAVGAELVHAGEELALSEGFGALLRHH